MTRVLFFSGLAFLLLASCGGVDSESVSETSHVSATTTAGLATITRPVTVTTPATKTAMEVAEEWIAAYEVGDVAAYQSLMSQGATYLCDCGYDRVVSLYFAPGGDAEPDVRDSRLLALANGSLNATCSAADDGATCETLRNSDFGFLTSDGEPTAQDQSVYEFTIEDGVITDLLVTRSGGNLFDFNVIQAYRVWLEDGYPDAHDELFAFSTILIATDDQFDQHQTYLAEYLADR